MRIYRKNLRLKKNESVRDFKITNKNLLKCISEKEDQDRMGRELRKEEELIRLSQKMMEDNEFRFKTTLEASENEIRDIAEFFIGKIRETENELIAVSEFFIIYVL